MPKEITSKEVKDELFYERCCGLDVHKKTVVACLRDGKKAAIREYGTMTGELRELAMWLRESGCQMAAMESTGSYWKPIYNILEMLEIDVIVVNASHLKNVPGRKTDVKDSEWIAKLLSQGNLRASYIPDREQRDRKELVRYRRSLIRERSREINRMQKMLEGANIKLTSVVDSVMGKSSRALVNATMNDKKITNDDVFSYISSNLKGKASDIVKAMDGIMSKTQKLLLKAVLDHIDDMTKRIDELTDSIDDDMKKYEEMIDNLDAIPGIGKESAQVIISEAGIDMDRFPTAGHFARWAGVCPGNNDSAGKKGRGKAYKGNSVLKSTLVQCAQSAVLTKNTFYRAQYDKLIVRRGKNRAKVAVAHSMAISIWHMLKHKVKFRDLGANYYNQFNKEKKVAMYLKKIMELGYTPTILAQA